MAQSTRQFTPASPSETLRAIVNGREVEHGPATTPLMTCEELEESLEASDARALHVYHLRAHKSYLVREQVPASWRGRRNIIHYEAVMFGLKEIQPPQYDRGILARVKRKDWLRRESKQRQREATKWFKNLPAAAREDLISDERHQAALERAEDRYVAKMTRENWMKAEKHFERTGQN